MSTIALSLYPLHPKRQARAARMVTVVALVVTSSVAGAQVARTAHVPVVPVVPVVAVPGANVVTVVAHDFAFVMPAAIPAGLTTFRLHDDGRQDHHLSIVRLDSGKTASDGLAALIKAGHGVRPSWMHSVGGPNAIMPGGEAVATLVLEPGNYMAYCEVPGPDAVPHFMKGMVKGFIVTGPAKSARRAATLPTADLTVTLEDFDFRFSRPLTPGRHAIAVTNSATQPHMMVMTWFPPGKGLKDFLQWAYDPKGRPGPGQAVGGVTEIAPGAIVVMTGDFKPGHYGVICFTPDAKDGKPHFMHGMQREFDVR